MIPDKKKIERTLKSKKAFLHQKFNVKTIGLFGSCVRDEAVNNSDIDLLVEFSKPVGFDFIRLKLFLEKELGQKVDLGTIETIKPALKETILKEAKFF